MGLEGTELVSVSGVEIWIYIANWGHRSAQHGPEGSRCPGLELDTAQRGLESLSDAEPANL